MGFNTAIPALLKLKLNPRKQQKRTRAFPPPPSFEMGSQRSCPPPRPVTPPPSEEMGAFADNVSALLRQEDSCSYSCVDYLSMTVWQNNMRQLLDGRLSKPLNNKAAPPESRIDEFCREQICEWSYRVTDYFRIDREVVSISISYLDRFLCTCSCDRSLFKLAATTTLYMAVKIFYPQKLGDLGVLSDLSRGEFNMKDVTVMEEHILHALSWRLHPPTGVAMSSLLLDYIFCESRFSNISSVDIDDIYENSCFFAELAVCDYFFVSLRPSTIALASILNAVEGLHGQQTNVIQHVLRALREISFPTERQELSAACNRLWELYERSEECALHHELIIEEERPVDYGNIFTKKDSNLALNSPVSVSSMNDGYRPYVAKNTLQNGSW